MSEGTTALCLSSADIIETLERAAVDAGFAPRTRRAYRRWVRAFTDFTDAHELDPDEAAARAFLGDLVVRTPDISTSTMEQARSALGFFFARLARDEDASIEAIRLPETVRRRRRTRPDFLVAADDDAERIIASLRGIYHIAAWLIYDAGLSAAETTAVRVGDVDLAAEMLRIGDAAPAVPNLGAGAVRALRHHLFHLHNRARKLVPDLSPAQWHAQHLLPTRSHMPTVQAPALWAPVSDEAVQRNVGRAFTRAGLPTERACTVLRNSCIWRLLRTGLEPRQIAAALGTSNVNHILRARRAVPLSTD